MQEVLGERLGQASSRFGPVPSERDPDQRFTALHVDRASSAVPRVRSRQLSEQALEPEATQCSVHHRSESPRSCQERALTAREASEFDQLSE